MTNLTEQQPTQNPPTQNQFNSASSIQSTPMDNLKMNIEAAATPSTLPAMEANSLEAAAVTTWNNSANINALWSINQDKNSWVGITGIGWKKLSTASESGIVALTMLASHAKEKNSLVYYREESDAMIHEFYVW